MEIAKKIEKLEKELRDLVQQREAEKKKARDKFVVKGKLVVAKTKGVSSYGLPVGFRRINISIEYINAEEAREVEIYVNTGGMTYHYLEGWIVGLGGGTVILDVPCKATEIEWQSIIDGDVPRKFLRDWVKKVVKE